MKTKILTLVRISIILALSGLLLTGCMGKDGKDGNAYESFDWDAYVDTYRDNNSSIPSTINRNQDYRTDPGTYSYNFDCSDGNGSAWKWSGTYTISINKGKPGEFLQDGTDGTDKYYNFYLSGTSGFEVSNNKESEALPINGKTIKDNLVKGANQHYNIIYNSKDKENTRFYYIDNTIIKVTSHKYILHSNLKE